jgi:hypothetical protein
MLSLNIILISILAKLQNKRKISNFLFVTLCQSLDTLWLTDLIITQTDTNGYEGFEFIKCNHNQISIKFVMH